MVYRIYSSNFAVLSFNSLSSSFIWSDELFWRLLILSLSSSIICLSFYISLSFSILFLSLASFKPASSKLSISFFLWASWSLSLSILISVFFYASCRSYFFFISSNSPFFKLDSFDKNLIWSSNSLILMLRSLFWFSRFPFSCFND